MNLKQMLNSAEWKTTSPEDEAEVMDRVIGRMIENADVMNHALIEAGLRDAVEENRVLFAFLKTRFGTISNFGHFQWDPRLREAQVGRLWTLSKVFEQVLGPKVISDFITGLREVKAKYERRRKERVDNRRDHADVPA